MKLNSVIVLFLTLCATFLAQAGISTQSVEYYTNQHTMLGYLAVPQHLVSDSQKHTDEIVPAIIIIHDWMGLKDFTKNKAQELAEKGYIAFAADIYGKDIRPKNSKEASKLSSIYDNNRALFKEHLIAAYNKLLTLDNVDPTKIVVMGYCFGGTGALELARSGVPLVGTVSFHGGLSNPSPSNAKNIKGKVLILHGGADPLVPSSEVEVFKQEMQQANKAFEFIAYEGAVHAFTNPNAGDDPSNGVAYNENADKASWQAFQSFLSKVLK